MKQFSERFHSLLLITIIGTLAWLIYAFLSNWSLGYNSDQALLGLMAKSVLENGERPIFVWSVGYQGIFMEVYATALVFHWFEANPFYLNFAPTFYFCVFLGLFYKVLRQYFDKMVAAFSCLFLLLSTPTLYLLTMRALPNFSESFLLGMLTFIVYSLMIKRVYMAKIFDRKSALIALGFGGLVGFSLYTYVLSWYFFIAACLCSFIIFIANVREWRGSQFISSYLRPQQSIRNPILRKIVGIPIYLFLGLAIFGAIGFFLDLDFTQYRLKGKRGVLPIHLLFGGIFFHTIITFTVHFFKYQDHRVQRSLGGLIFFVGLLAGFSPKLYYWLVLGGRTKKGATVSGKLDQILDRLSLGIKANNDFLRLPIQFKSFGLMEYGLLALSLFCIGYLFWSFAKKLRVAFAEGTMPELVQEGLPFLCLPFVILLAFSLSSAVVDGGSGRYLLAILIFYAVAYSYTAVSLWRRHKNALARVIIASLTFMVLYRGGLNIHNGVVHESNTKNELAHLVKVLDEHQISYAYGDYWTAYNVNLFTQERIVIEPIYSNYSPHYAARMEKQERIAYIDRKEPKYPVKDNQVVINDKTYNLEKKVSIDRHWDMYVLVRGSLAERAQKSATRNSSQTTY